MTVLYSSGTYAAAPHTNKVKEGFFLGERSPPQPSHRVGVGGNRVSPYPCWGLRPPKPSCGWGVGKPGFPTSRSEGLCSR